MNNREQEVTVTSSARTPPLAQRARRRFCMMLGALGLGACGGPQVVSYRNEKPILDLRHYFNGHVQGQGVFRDRGGQVKRRFTVKLLGRWEGENGVLEEDFTYLDEESRQNPPPPSQQRRVWHLRDLGVSEGVRRYEGRADDVVGTALGEASGNALHWQYRMRLPVDGRDVEVDFDDWMYLVDEQVMLNQAVMSKWGIRLGEVSLSFTKSATMP